MKHLTVCISLIVAAACTAQEGTKPDTPAANAKPVTTGKPQPASSSPASADDKPGLKEEIYERARKRNGGKEPTRIELWDEFVRKAQEVSGAIEDFGQPRKVHRGAQPEIVIKGEKITFNGQLLKLGDTLDNWKQVLPANPKCTLTKEKNTDHASCFWDEIGLSVITDSGNSEYAKQLTIFLSIEHESDADKLVTQRPDGTPISPKAKNQPSKPFPGYLELDGYGIDKDSQFWEVRQGSDPKRQLHCGLRDCSHPLGRFGERSSIYIRLNGGSERSTLRNFTINRSNLE